MKLFSMKSAARYLALGTFLTAPYAATAAQPHTFAGERIEIIVPFSPGGGTDIYVRALAPFLEKHLPGKPTIIVRNIPGARGIPGTNQFEARGRKDGTTAIASSASTVATYVLERSKVEYDMSKWEPVLISPQGAVVYARTSLGVKGPKDIPKLKGQQLVFGGQSPGSAELRTITTFELLGLKPKYVWGLNRGPVRLAFERGELNINYDSAPGFLKGAMPLVKSGLAAPIYTMGILDESGKLVRDPNFPDLPHFGEAYEIMHGKKPSGDGFEAWLAAMKMLVMLNKSLFLPAGTPKPAVEAWRTAVRNMLKDPEFDKTAGKVIEGYPQTVGEAARPIIREATTFTPAVWKWLDNYLKTEHNVTIER